MLFVWTVFGSTLVRKTEAMPTCLSCGPTGACCVGPTGAKVKSFSGDITFIFTASGVLCCVLGIDRMISTRKRKGPVVSCTSIVMVTAMVVDCCSQLSSGLLFLHLRIFTQTGAWVGVGYTLIGLIAWVGSYFFRVATKNMTYAVQVCT